MFSNDEVKLTYSQVFEEHILNVLFPFSSLLSLIFIMGPILNLVDEATGVIDKKNKSASFKTKFTSALC